MAPELPGDPWRYATWEGAEIADLLLGRRMPLAAKLERNEEMSAWVRRVEERIEGRGVIPPDRDMPSS